MMKRITWFAAGAATGAAGAAYATRKVKEQAAKMTPSNVARVATERAKRTGRDVADAIRDGRAAMRSREDELRARRDGRVSPIAEHLAPDEQLLVDGRPVDTARVIVLRPDRTS